MNDKVDPLNLEIGLRIKSAREEKGWSRKALAQKGKLTEQSLLYVETGRRGLSSHTIRGISRALNVTADFLLFGQTDTINRVDYASQALANLTDEEHKHTLEIIDKVADLLRGYE